MSDAPDPRAEHPRLNLFGMILLIAVLALGVRWIFRQGAGPLYLAGCYASGTLALLGLALDRKRVDATMLLTVAAAPLTMPVLLAVTLLETGETLLSRWRKRPETSA